MFLLLLPFFASATVYNETFAEDVSYFAALSYCTLEVIKDWNCGAPCERHPNFEVYDAWNITVSGSLSNVVVGINHDTDDIIVSLEGTKDVTELLHELTDFNLIPYTPHVLPNATVDDFFLNAYVAAQDRIISTITTVKEIQNKVSQPVIVTGHSLGGSIAALVAIDLVLSGVVSSEELQLITYGEPRTGNPDFAKYMDKYVPNSWRLVHSGDIVPHVPLSDMIYLEFEQHSTEIWYNEKMDSYTVCGPDEDLTCSDSLNPLEYSIEDHLYYFGYHISADCPCNDEVNLRGTVLNSS